jgi:hypothetical protein
LLLIGAFAYVHQKHFDSATPASRLDLLHALVQEGSLRIDAYEGNTPDEAIYGGHFYSDKPPGTVMLALMPFTVASMMLTLAGIELDSPRGWLVSSWVASVGSLGLLTALGGAALFVWLLGWVGPRPAMATTLAACRT